MNNREKFKEAIINKYGYHNFTIDDAKAICESIGLTDSQYKTIYTHVMRHVKVDKGIYAFTNIALTKYVKLARSKLEIQRNLEQMRALENNLIIKVGLSDSLPLGIDTEEDLEKISKEMKLL